MIISSFYNEEKKILMLSTDLNYNEIILEKNIKENYEEVKILNEENVLIGVNLLGYYNSSIKTGIVNNNEIMDIIVTYFGKEIESPFVVGFVRSIEKHPESDKLNICQVDLGDKNEQIVCGASNVDKGIKVIVSKVGAVMPNGLIIKPSKLLGKNSNGMITSFRELGIYDSKEQGIAILDDKLEIGSSYNV